MIKKIVLRFIGLHYYQKYIKFIDQLYNSFLPFNELGISTIKKHILKKGDTCLDIGGHIGRFTGFAARCVCENGRVICFEPLPQSLRVLKATVLLRRMKQVTIVEKALSDETATATIHVPLREDLMPLLPMATIGKHTDRKSLKFTIQTIRLDEYCKSAGIDRVDFIKIDTEGHEYAVLMGGLKTIRSYLPTIFCELDDQFLKNNKSNPGQIFTLFEEIGYHSYFPSHHQRLQKVDSYKEAGDYFFIHPTRISSEIIKTIV